MRVRTRGRLALALTLALFLPAQGYAAQADADEGASLTRATHGATTRAEHAARALRRAQALLHTPASHPSSRARTGRRTGHAIGPRTGRDATLALRDLALSIDSLSGVDRRAADRLLARPTDSAADPDGTAKYRVPGEVTCSEHFCVHWVTSTADAPPVADSEGDGVPDWVRTTEGVLEHVWDSIVVDAGYREPKSDEGSPDHGPDGRLDVYLADVGVNKVYGYCTSDDPERAVRFDVSSYCVLDNDFSPDQFPTAPHAALEVTAAHEFFHAVQFSYDWTEDRWLTEGTAAWMEDVVYDAINDNRQYLALSPLARPDLPVDFDQYGAWVFWRYLAELFGSPGTPDRSVIRQVWEAADAAPGGPDASSLQAVRQVAAGHGVGFADLFAGFARVNRTPARWYDEGSHYPRAPLSASYRLTRLDRSTTAQHVELSHLSSGYVRFRPTRSLRGRWRLRLVLDLPDRVRGPVATTVVHRRGGHEKVQRIALNRHGRARLVLPFNRAHVAWVELDLSNASDRFVCWQGTGLSCDGAPLDDFLPFRYTATAVSGL
jgi:hypothetical protein